MVRSITNVIAVLATIVCTQTEADEPLTTIALVSNPYITKLAPEEITDERGSVREFLAKTGPESFSKVVSLINRLRTDAVVIQGSLTWTGLKQDFEAVREFVDQIDVRVYTMPGHRDWSDGTLDAYRHVFGDLDSDLKLKSLNDSTLVFASDLHGTPDKSSSRIRQQLSQAPKSKSILLFADRDGEFKPSNLKSDYSRLSPESCLNSSTLPPQNPTRI